MKELIAVNAALPVPAPQLRLATLAHWAQESDFGRSPLAKQHRNFAKMAWNEQLAEHASILSAGATKVELAEPGAAAVAYYAFTSNEAFVRGYWRRIMNSLATVQWHDYETDETAFVRYIASKWRPADSSYGDTVAKLLLALRMELEPGSVKQPSKPVTPPLKGPDGVLFKWTSGDYRKPHGLLMEVLQAALLQQNMMTGTADGKFGKGTLAAIKKSQEAAGVTADGVCRFSDWERITGLPTPSLYDRCLNLTAAYEGTGFKTAEGNSDDAFLTWGIIGYTLKDDLPGFLKLVESEYAGTLKKAFGDKTAELLDILSAPESRREAWANSITTGASREGVRKDWKDAFAALGSVPEVQKLQLIDARKRYWTKLCLRDAKRFGAKDELDLALLFDTAVQNGGLGDKMTPRFEALAVGQPGLQGAERRQKWAQIIADCSKAKYAGKVLERRMAIATGDGRAQGEGFRMADWGLSPIPVDIDALSKIDVEEDITFMPADTVSGAPKPVALFPPHVLEAAPKPAIITPPGVVKFDLARDFKLAMAAAAAIAGRAELDNKWGPPPGISVTDLLGQNSGTLPGDWQQWDDKRKAVALVQLVANARDLSIGEVDGFWGQMVEWAIETLISQRDGKKPDDNFRDTDDPIDVNPHGFPLENKSQSEIIAFFGQHGTVPLVKVPCPWPLHMTDEPKQKVKSISIHAKLADSLAVVFDKVYKHYGEDELIRLRLNNFSGSFNDRKMRGSDRWSMHAYGIAIDWDDNNNQLKWGRDRATMAAADYRIWWEIWESEGWSSLGRVKNYDWMHVQAAKIKT